MVGNVYDKSKNVEMKENIDFLSQKVFDLVDSWEISMNAWEKSRDYFDVSIRDLVHYAAMIQNGEKISEDIEVEQ